jgi:carboxyl-terminal processing protease
MKFISFMLNKKVWPVVLAVVGVMVVVVATTTRGSGKSEPANKYERILTTVADILEQAHFSPKQLDDNFSKAVFKQYIDALDPEKQIFRQQDIIQLKKYETTIDNELRTGKMAFVPAVDELYKARMGQIAGFYKTILSQPFDFTASETLGTKAVQNYAGTDAEQIDMWRKRLKFMTLERYAEALDQREKNKGKADFVAKPDSTLERESRETVARIWERNLARMNKKFGLDEKFNLYVGTIAETMDPHTEFFPPVEKRGFDEQMSGRFFGIGAQLAEKDGVIKIESVITGSPAWKSGEVQVNDVILKVGQGTAEPIDISGYETTDAVQIIRGKRGTEVRLTLKKEDGTIKVVSIIRDEIVQEEAYARSAVIEKNGKKIGFIHLQDFYADFDDPNGAYSARDVAKALKALKAENVDGVVLDLRFNGGGSLQEVIKMVGLFIEDGPVVQVKDRDGEVSVSGDKDKTVLYDGPFAVMINEYSASASEIFAAAIQDYGRGIIIGSQSYGKGSVQRNIGLDRDAGYFSSVSELGTIKVTTQKFYRINGGSVQLEGVKPDVVLPDNWEFSASKERDAPHALPWDEVAKAGFRSVGSAGQVQAIARRYQLLAEQKQGFKLIRDNNKWLKQVSDGDVSLKLADFMAEQQKVRTTLQQNTKLQTLSAPLQMSYLAADEARISQMDAIKAKRYRDWLNRMQTDVYLDESVAIISEQVDAYKTAKN